MNIAYDRGRSLLLATDGACLGNPGRGGWAVIVHEIDGDAVVSRSTLAGHADGNTTNNQMELQAAIEALRLASEMDLPATIITDSQYVQKGITEWVPSWKNRGWRTADRKPVKNREQWETLHQFASGRQVIWQWVRGHSGHELNEAADSIARDAACGLVGTEEKLRHCHPAMFTEGCPGDPAA